MSRLGGLDWSGSGGLHGGGRLRGLLQDRRRVPGTPPCHWGEPPHRPSPQKLRKEGHPTPQGSRERRQPPLGDSCWAVLAWPPDSCLQPEGAQLRRVQVQVQGGEMQRPESTGKSRGPSIHLCQESAWRALRRAPVMDGVSRGY